MNVAAILQKWIRNCQRAEAERDEAWAEVQQLKAAVKEWRDRYRFVAYQLRPVDQNIHCKVCNRTEIHRQFGGLWRCSDCGEPNSPPLTDAELANEIAGSEP